MDDATRSGLGQSPAEISQGIADGGAQRTAPRRDGRRSSESQPPPQVGEIRLEHG